MTQGRLVALVFGPDILKALKPFLLSNWVSIARVVALFPRTSQSRPSTTATDLETPCVCARHDRCPKSSAIDFAVETFVCLLEMPIARWQAGARTRTQTWTLQQDQRVVEVFKLSAPKSQNKLCGVWILLVSLKMPKLRTGVSWYQPSSTRLSQFSFAHACLNERVTTCPLNERTSLPQWESHQWEEWFCRSFKNHDCLETTSQVTPQGSHQHANANCSKGRV